MNRARSHKKHPEGSKVARHETVSELLECAITCATTRKPANAGNVCVIEYMHGTQCVTLRVTPGPRWNVQAFVDCARDIGWVAEQTNTPNVWELCERNYRATFAVSVGRMTNQQRAQAQEAMRYA